MRLLSVLILTIALLFGCSTTNTYQRVPSEKTRYYNDIGRYQGYSVKTKYSTRYYDKDGRFVGKSQ